MIRRPEFRRAAAAMIERAAFTLAGLALGIWHAAHHSLH